MSKIKKTIAILLVVLFVVTVTASAVSASHPVLKHISYPTAVSVKDSGSDTKSTNSPTSYYTAVNAAWVYNKPVIIA